MAVKSIERELKKFYSDDFIKDKIIFTDPYEFKDNIINIPGKVSQDIFQK